MISQYFFQHFLFPKFVFPEMGALGLCEVILGRELYQEKIVYSCYVDQR